MMEIKCINCGRTIGRTDAEVDLPIKCTRCVQDESCLVCGVESTHIFCDECLKKYSIKEIMKKLRDKKFME